MVRAGQLGELTEVDRGAPVLLVSLRWLQAGKMLGMPLNVADTCSCGLDVLSSR